MLHPQRPLHTSRIDHRCSDAQGLRKAASPSASPGARPPAERHAGSGPTHHRTAETPRACSQRLTRGVAPHAQTPKSRRSDSQDCEENPSLFGFLLGTRDAGVDLPRTNFGGPCPEPQRSGGSLDPESRGPLGCREGHFRYRHVPHSPRGEALGEAKNCTCCCDAGSETHLGQGSCAVCLHGTCGRASCRDGKLT